MAHQCQPLPNSFIFLGWVTQFLILYESLLGANVGTMPYYGHTITLSASQNFATTILRRLVIAMRRVNPGVAY